MHKTYIKLTFLRETYKKYASIKKKLKEFNLTTVK